MRLALSLCLLTCIKGTETLQFGSTVENQGSKLFKMHVTYVSKDYQVRFQLERLDGEAELYVSDRSDVSPQVYQWSSGRSSHLSLFADNLQPQSDYFILIHCVSACHYQVTLQQLWTHPLAEGTPLTCLLEKLQPALFTISINNQPTSDARFSLLGSHGLPLLVNITGFEGENSASLVPIPLKYTHFAHMMILPSPKQGKKYWFEVVSSEKLQITALIAFSESFIELTPQRILEDFLDIGLHRLYSFYLNDTESVIKVSITVLSGEVQICAKYQEIPHPQSCDFQSPTESPNILLITEDNRKELGLGSGLYYLRVDSVAQYLHYTIAIAMEKEEYLRLVPGVVQQGAVRLREVDKMMLEVPEAGDWNVSITMKARKGHPKMRAWLCTTADFNCSAASALTTSLDTLIIPHYNGTCQAQASCRFLIEIGTPRPETALYSLHASYDDNTVHTLTCGEAIRVSQPANGLTRRYILTILDESNTHIRVAIAQFSGKTKVCITRDSTTSVMVNCIRRTEGAVGSVREVEMSRGADGVSLTGAFYVLLYSEGTYSEFELKAEGQKAVGKEAIELESGLPQRDQFDEGNGRSEQLYYFDIQYLFEVPQGIKVRITAMSGSFNLYLSSTTVPTKSQCLRALYGILPNTTDPTIFLSPTHPDFLSNARYFLLVESLEANSSLYYLRFDSGDGIPALLEGVYATKTLTSRRKLHFKCLWSEGVREIIVKIAILSGNMELYWSTDGNSPRPDVIRNDGLINCYINCTFLLSRSEYTSFTCKYSTCYVYFTIISEQLTNLQLKYSQIPTISLRCGEPVAGTLEREDYAHYWTSIPGDSWVELVLVSTSGDADLFVNAGIALNGLQTDSISFPETGQYMYSSANGGAVDRLLIDLNVSDTVGLAISVYCRSETCQFTISASQETLELVDGAPAYGFVASLQSRFYHFYCPYDNANITLRFTLFSGQPVTLFASKDQDYYPNETHYQWVQRDWTQRQMVLRSTANIGQSMQGKYLITLLASNASSYALTLMLGKDMQVQLLPGVPAAGESYRGEVDYFTFESFKSADIDISVTPTLGSIALYINPFLSPRPQSTAYTWSSEHSPVPNRVLIAAADPYFCYPCVYLIAVVGRSSEQVYTIVASHSTDVTQLRNGVPVSGILEKGEVKRYLLQIEDRLPLDAALTSYSGNVDLYISDKVSVGAGNSLWNSTETSRTDHIRIPAPPSLLYLAVECVQDSHFSLTVHIRDSYIQLVDGWPVLYSLECSADDHLFFSFQAGDRPVQCALRPMVRNFFPRVYVTFQPLHAQAVKPAPEVADMTFDKRSDFENALGELNFRVIKEDSPGKYNIGVYSRSDQPEIGAFSLLCSSQNLPIHLTSGHSGFGTLSKEHSAQTYSLHIPEFSLLEVSVMPCSGRTRLLISSNWAAKDDSEAEVVVTTLADGRLYGTLVHAKGVYYVKVEMMEESEFMSGASYEIFAQVRAGRRKPQLQAGNDGIITWKQISGHRFRLQWSPPELDSGQALIHHELVRYRVYYSQEPDYPLKTVCGIAVGELNSLVFQPSGHPFAGQTAFVLYIPAIKPTTVALVAYVDTEEREIAIPYEPLLINAQPRVGFGGWRPVAYGLIALALLVCIAGAVVYARYRAAKRRLDYELSEVRQMRQDS